MSSSISTNILTDIGRSASTKLAMLIILGGGSKYRLVDVTQPWTFANITSENLDLEPRRVNCLFWNSLSLSMLRVQRLTLTSPS